MTGRVRRKTRTNTLAILTALGAVAMLACGPETFEIPIETPIQPKLDVSAFQRVLVAGFVAGGSTISTRIRRLFDCCEVSFGTSPP